MFSLSAHIAHSKRTFYSSIYFVAEVTVSARNNKCDSGVVGNARPCQGRDRGFEPRLSLLGELLKQLYNCFVSKI